jgi:hypothetical protein
MSHATDFGSPTEAKTPKASNPLPPGAPQGDFQLDDRSACSRGTLQAFNGLQVKRRPFTLTHMTYGAQARPIFRDLMTMMTQLMNFHLPLHTIVAAPRRERETPAGTLSQAELRRIVADMVD